MLLVLLACAALQTDVTRNTWGAPGFQRAVEPIPLLAHGLTLSLQGRFGLADNFLTAEDTARVFTQEGHLLWSPHRALDIGLGFSATNVADAQVPGGGASAVGSPSLRVRWTYLPPWALQLGALLEIAPPASGSGLALQDPALALSGLLGWRPSPSWHLALNLGFTFDRSVNALQGPVSRAQHFASGLTLANRMHAIIAAGWQADTQAGVWEPFAEWVGEWATGNSTPNGIALLSLGGKWLPPTAPFVQLAAGVDIRLRGAVATDSAFPGLMPWTLYARITLSSAYLQAPPVPTALLCTPAPAAVRMLPPPLHGTLRDMNDHPVKDAMIVVRDVPTGEIFYDPSDGHFVIKDFACAQNQTVDIVVSVPGALDQRLPVPCNAWLAAPEASVDIQFSRQAVPSSIRCYVRDKRTGAAIAGAHISLGRDKAAVAQTNSEGVAEFQRLEPGVYQVIIQAQGHIQQKRVTMVDEASTTIINVGLEPL